MDAKYGSARYCPQGPESCRDEVQLKAVLEKSRDYDELLEAWKGWHDAARLARGTEQGPAVRLLSRRPGNIESVTLRPGAPARGPSGP